MANYNIPSDHVLVGGELVKTEDAGPRLKIEHKGTIYESPPLKVLQYRVEQHNAGSSIYEALDGCLLEFAHTKCEHDCPSWLRYLWLSRRSRRLSLITTITNEVCDVA